MQLFAYINQLIKIYVTQIRHPEHGHKQRKKWL